jgi:hypothetical protein
MENDRGLHQKVEKKVGCLPCPATKRFLIHDGIVWL